MTRRPTLSFLARVGFACVASLVALLFSSPSRALSLATGDSGVVIDAGGMGTFHLDYPELIGSAPHKIIARTLNGSSATVDYDGGAKVTVDASNPSRIIYTLSGLPADVSKAKVTMIIDFSYQQGGRWRIGAKAGTFPAEKPPQPHLYAGNETHFDLTDAQGQTLALRTPDYGWLELNDNREWNWSVYSFQTQFPLLPGVASYKIELGQGATTAGKSAPVVDEFGQIAAGDWPGKLHSADELKADVESEKTYYAGLTPPARDAFGGLPGSGEKLGLSASGFFHVEKKDAKWILVDPAGNAFFQLGICAFAPGDDYTLVSGRPLAFAWLPPRDGEFATAYQPNSKGAVLSFYLANTIRKYGGPFKLDEFQTRMIDRVRRFGFNSIGAFSPAVPAVVKAENFPYVAHLPLGAWGDRGIAGIPRIPGITETWDPFDPANVAKVDKNFAAALPARADDPLLIGYFLVNEPLYEDIAKVVPGLKGTWACKRALVAQLGAKYRTIDAFNAAWGLSATSFDALNDAPLAVNTKAAYDDLHTFTGTFFETYFNLVETTFHKYDTHHLLIGNRLQPGTINNQQLCEIAGRHLDIMSFNYYTNQIDRDFLDRIERWTGRPMILSEFFWAAPRESGLVGGREVATQQARGLAYRNYVEQAAATGYVVGVEWFTLIDQASTGRWFSGYSGERSNTGLFAVSDRPYRPMLAEMAKANADVYDVWLGGKAPYVFDDPSFAQTGNAKAGTTAPHATGPIAVDGTTRNWPGIPPNTISGKRLVLGSEAGGVEGTFKVCWDETNLYILATVIDPTPMMSKVPVSSLWSGDALEIFTGTEKLDDGGPLLFTDRHLTVGVPGPGEAPFHYDNTPGTPDCQALVVPGSDGKSYTVEVAMPWSAIGAQPQAGTELLFDLGIDDSASGTGRRAQLMWSGTDKNSGDRTHWGRLKLLQ